MIFIATVDVCLQFLGMSQYKVLNCIKMIECKTWPSRLSRPCFTVTDRIYGNGEIFDHLFACSVLPEVFL